MSDINKNRATDPNQYGRPELSWSKQTKENPRYIFFGDYLKRHTPSWKGKTVLDIGSGNGWLLNEAKQAGAKSVIGIEPSTNNTQQSKQEYPDLEVVQTSLEEFDSKNQKFDEVTAVMSFPHIKNLDGAFTKVAGLLNQDGEFLIVTPDYEYSRSQRKNYKVEVEDLSADEYVATVTRPSGVLVDLVRKDDLYIQAAKRARLELVEQVPMTPTENYLATNPDYAQDPNLPLTQLLRFKKQ